jgi:hypothetical protein
MGFDLYSLSDESYFRWNMWGFPPIRFLGELYGWEPMGTIVQIEGEEEEGCWYETNDGQIVCKEDAKNWAKALEKAIPDIPIVAKEDTTQFLNDEYMKRRSAIWRKEKDAIMKEFDTEDSVEYIKDFIVFLRKGAFRIY